MNSLIGAEELAARLHSAGSPIVLDVRWRLNGPPGIESYQAGHVPGSVFVDLDRDLAAPPGEGGRHPLPSAQDFQAVMRRAGVRRDSSVVAYDDSDASSAARAWWLLRYFGHDAVAVLNGGWRAWTSGDHPVSVEAAEPREGDFVARPGAMPIVDAEGAARLADKRLLIDVRVGPRFRGEMEPVDPIAGHIPGAVNLPAAENVNEDGLFRSAADLRERFAAFTGAEGVGVSCGSGVVATQTVLAMELAGIRASLYPGSWSGWITDLSRPLAVGAED